MIDRETHTHMHTHMHIHIHMHMLHTDQARLTFSNQRSTLHTMCGPLLDECGTNGGSSLGCQQGLLVGKVKKDRVATAALFLAITEAVQSTVENWSAVRL